MASSDHNTYDDEQTFSLQRFIEACDVVHGPASQLLFKRTAMVPHWQDTGDLSTVTGQCEVYLKLENTQVTGSYKVRGVLNQLHQFIERHSNNASSSAPINLVTMSAGNYGKAFAFVTAAVAAAGEQGRSELMGRRLVVMPSTAPTNRQTVIESFGAEVVRVANPELVNTVNAIIKDNGFYFMPSINDDDLILGHGSVGIEILEDLLPDIADIILVPCGGGALLAAVATVVKLSLKGRRKSCRVYGIEPVGANTMWQSLRAGLPVSMPTASSIAAGLAPPYAGDAAYRLCRQHVDDILLVSDAAIGRAVTQLYQQGFVVEPSGAVGYAALSEGMVPNISGCKVVLLLSGGNITAEDMVSMFQM